MENPRTWCHALHSPLRDDAPGIFVKADDLPGAAVGDRVIVEPPPDDSSPARAATVAAVDQRDGAPFLRLDFETP